MPVSVHTDESSLGLMLVWTLLKLCLPGDVRHSFQRFFWHVQHVIALQQHVSGLHNRRGTVRTESYCASRIREVPPASGGVSV
jgi:hypothetical protein